MKTIFKSRQNGFAIIEALIAFLLLGIGVAALLYLQGSLMGGSSLSKARAEAMELAKDRTELLRNYIQKDQYLSALSSVQSGSVTGVNAIYNVSYASVPNSIDDAQLLTVNVNWAGSEGNTEEVSLDTMLEVSLDTMLYFTDPVILSALGSDDSGEGGGIFPLVSPWITGVEKRHHSTDLDSKDDTRSGFLPHRVMDIDGDNNITFSDIVVYVNTYTASGTDRFNVEVVVDDDVKLTSFGGVVHQIKGDVIINPGAGSSLITLKKTTALDLFASPPSYCLFSICEDALVDQTETCKKSNGAEYVSYICYVPGDCTYGDDDSDNNIGCPNPFLPPIGMDDLNGGWYGKVGNFNVDLPGDKVCTAETAGKLRTPSRDYVTHRWNVAGTEITGNEGINTPYSNQTFLIVNKNDDCLVQIGDYSSENYLVNDHIERDLVGEKRPKTDELVIDQLIDNVVLLENECTAGGLCTP